MTQSDRWKDSKPPKLAQALPCVCVMYKDATPCHPILLQRKTIIDQNSTATALAVFVAAPARDDVDHALLLAPTTRHNLVSLLRPGHVNVCCWHGSQFTFAPGRLLSSELLGRGDARQDIWIHALDGIP